MRVMVVGASNDRKKFGNKAVRAYDLMGHEVVPINPNATEVEGVRSYPSVSAFKGFVDRVLMYVPPRVGMKVVEELAARGQIGEVWFNPGSESHELLELTDSLQLNRVVACSIIDIGASPDR